MLFYESMGHPHLFLNIWLHHSSGIKQKMQKKKKKLKPYLDLDMNSLDLG